MTRAYYLLLLLMVHASQAVNVTDGGASETAALANLTAGNDLWSALVKGCKEPTLSCVKDIVYNFLKGTLEYPADVQFTSFLRFAKNSLNYSDPDAGNATRDGSWQDDQNALEEMTRSLHDNTVKFFMTHDVELQLPDPFFHGSTIKIAPKSLDDDGAIVKLELMPRMSSEVGEGRLFFKKIKKFISERLVYAFLAILLVVKLLAAKFLFILPMILGAATAKKILIKILLFIFPALHHLFKLCAYYPTQAKYHHHKHLISHIHSVAHKYPQPHHGGHHHHHDGVEVIAPHSGGPPSHHHGGHFDDHELHHDHHDYYDPHDNDLGVSFYPGSPGIGNDIIAHRHDPHEEEAWAQGHSPAKRKKNHKRPLTSAELENIVLKAEKEALIKARLQKEKQRIQEENMRLQEQLNKALKLQEKLKHHQAVVSHLKATPHISFANQKKGVSPPSPFLESPPISPPASVEPIPPQPGPVIAGPFAHPAPTIPNSLIQVPPGVTLPQASKVYNAYQEIHQKNTQLQVQQQQFQQPDVQPKASSKQPVYQQPKKQPVEVQPLVVGSVEVVKSVEPEVPKAERKIYQAALITFDPFYSPILEKIDKILDGLGFAEEPCKERLICSMYKSPAKFSPHSNLLSAELSRDAEELQKPKNTNAAVIRFYKYVQAARDGQDGRDCLRLYPACAVNTES